MRILFIIGISIFLSSCQNNDASKEIKSEDKLTDTTVTNTKTKEVAVKIDSSKIPSPTFLKLIEFIDSSGYMHDTAFIHKVGMYRYSDSVVYFEKKPFFIMEPKESYAVEVSVNSKSNANLSEYSEFYFNENLFLEAKHIFAFYYREKNMDDWVTDGFVEEWYFEDSIKAEKALLDFKKNNRHMYFNTASFGKREKNRLYIMYTRAAGFGMFLDKVYQELKRIID